jgi:hypothetical protein
MSCKTVIRHKRLMNIPMQVRDVRRASRKSLFREHRQIEVDRRSRVDWLFVELEVPHVQ